MLTPSFQAKWDICKLHSFPSHPILNMPQTVNSQASCYLILMTSDGHITRGLSRSQSPWDNVVLFSNKLCSLVLTCSVSLPSPLPPSSFPSPLQPLTPASLLQLWGFPVPLPLAHIRSDELALSNLVHIYGSKMLCTLLTI